MDKNPQSIEKELFCSKVYQLTHLADHTEVEHIEGAMSLHDRVHGFGLSLIELAEL
jgi:hypothetical protein